MPYTGLGQEHAYFGVQVELDMATRAAKQQTQLLDDRGTQLQQLETQLAQRESKVSSQARSCVEAIMRAC